MKHTPETYQYEFLDFFLPGDPDQERPLILKGSIESGRTEMPLGPHEFNCGGIYYPPEVTELAVLDADSEIELSDAELEFASESLFEHIADNCQR